MRALGVHGPAGDDGVVLGQHAIVEDGHPRRIASRAVGSKVRAMKYDVVGLPLTWWPARIHKWGCLSVHGCRLAVGVGVVVIRVQYLDLVVTHQEHATVAALLTFALGRGGRRPFDVQLHATEP